MSFSQAMPLSASAAVALARWLYFAFQRARSSAWNSDSSPLVKTYWNSFIALAEVASAGSPSKMPMPMWSWVGVSHSKPEKISLPV